MSIQKAFEIIEAHQEEADFFGEIEEKTISDGEMTLNVKFPESYRGFLKKYGLGDIFGEEIFGLGTEATGIPNVIWVTEDLRKTEGLPEHLVCFYFTGSDEYFCLDCSDVPDGEPDRAPVVSFISGLPISDQPFELIAESFADFLLEILMDSVEE